MVATMDEPREIDRGFALGSNCYITKPVEYDRFIDMANQIQRFLSVSHVPRIKF